MFEILTADQSKHADALTIGNGAPGLRLMEAAGAAFTHEITERFKPCPVLVLCGPGNNGGDGFIAARELKKSGWNVRLACLVKKNALKGDAALAAKTWDGEAETLSSNLSLKDTGLVVDAVFGTGFSRALDPELVTLFDKIRAKKIPVAAIDLPSGIDATGGTVAQGALAAALTVTFTRRKNAHVLLPAKTLCGRVTVAHIGITDETVALTGAQSFENTPALWIKNYPVPGPAAHKYDRGHTAVLGGKKRTGAACLAAAAAQRIGSGLTTLLAPAESAAIYQSYRASLMTEAWESIDDLRSILRDERLNALVIGPGLGADARPQAEAALSLNRLSVLDADVFTLYKSNPKDLFSKLSPAKHILTPHEGEFARLFPDISSGNKIDRARRAAATANALVLLKGSDTVLAAPDGAAIVNTNAPPTLATGGSGDVLSGFIAGLAAQGMPLFMAAAAACWLHAETARNHGFGLTPEDIITSLNQALNRLFRLEIPEA